MEKEVLCCLPVTFQLLWSTAGQVPQASTDQKPIFVDFWGGGFLWARCPSWRSNNSFKAVEAIKQTQVVTWRDLSRYPVVGRTRLSLVSLDQVYYKRIHTGRTKHIHTFNFRYIIIQKYTHKNTCVHTQYTYSWVLFNQPYFSLVSPVQAGFPTQITS